MIDSGETLWSIVEATEFADLYCGFPAMDSETLRDKFGKILKGPVNPQRETEVSNRSRNTLFELNLAGWLSHRGIPTTVPRDNPDICCALADRFLFIQCKRPYTRRSVKGNLKDACRQLNSDLHSTSDTRHRGVVAISMSKAINSETRFLHVPTEANLTSAIASQMHDLASYYVSRFIQSEQIIGAVFHAITAAFVEDINEYRTAQVLALYPSARASPADRALLRNVFVKCS